MPPDISNTGQESIRGFLTRFLPKTLRPSNDRYGDGWQQKTVSPGFLRDYPILFPQQQGPSFITPTQRQFFTFPNGGTPNPPDEPPIDDPPGSGDPPGTGTPPGTGDPPGTGSGSGSGTGPTCPFYYRAETCTYPGTGEPACGVGSGLDLYICSDLECLDGPGSGSGPEIPADGQVFTYLGRCWTLDTAVEYYRESPPPGGVLLPADGVVVSTPTIDCVTDCNAAECAREDVWFLATPCESCTPPDGTLIPAFCGDDWAETVGTDGACVYFQYGGHCYYVGIDSEPISTIDGMVHVAIDRTDFEATLQSCCQCCDTCMYTTARDIGEIDTPCAPDEDCCCGSAFELEVQYIILFQQSQNQLTNDGTFCCGVLTSEQRVTGTFTATYDGSDYIVTSSTVEVTYETYDCNDPSNPSSCNPILRTTETYEVKPRVGWGCTPSASDLWPSEIQQPESFSFLDCVCSFVASITWTTDGVGTITESSTQTTVGASCGSLTLVNSAVPWCPNASITALEADASHTMTCTGGLISVIEDRFYFCDTDCSQTNVYHHDTRIDWVLTVTGSCDDGCSGGPGSGAFL